MKGRQNHLRPWLSFAIVLVVILLLPGSGYDWLRIHQPRLAFILFVAGYSGGVFCFGMLTWNLWRMVKTAYKLDWPAKSIHRRTAFTRAFRPKVLMHLYFACIMTVGTIGALGHLLLTIFQRFTV